MTNGIFIAAIAFGTIYLLFIRERSLMTIINPTRWMVFAWIVLFSVAIGTPIQFHVYKINMYILAYCGAWLVCFYIGQTFGASIYRRKFNRKIKIRDSVNYIILILSASGCLVLTIINWSTIMEVVSNPFAVASRREYFTYDSGGYLVTIAIFVAFGGLLVGLAEFVSAIWENRPVKITGYLGILQYAFVYVLGAGRQGFAIVLVALFVAVVAAMYLRRGRYRFFRRLVLLVSGTLLVGVLYTLFIVKYRSTGTTGSIEWKMEYSNGLYNATVSDNFRNSVLNAGPFGMLTMEFFYYASPQLYGLSYTIEKFGGRHTFGAVQFPYFARRIERLLGVDILAAIEDEYEKMYDSQGLFGHFFRTAVENTYLDFGLSGGLIFIFICGIGAGVSYKAALTNPSPEGIVLVAMICSGAAFTIVFSPFAETGYAFPMLWFIVRIPLKWI